MKGLFLVVFLFFSGFAIDIFALGDNAARIDLVKQGEIEKACKIIAKDEWEDFFSRCLASPKNARAYLHHCLKQTKEPSKEWWACSTLLIVFQEPTDRAKVSRSRRRDALNRRRNRVRRF